MLAGWLRSGFEHTPGFAELAFCPLSPVRHDEQRLAVVSEPAGAPCSPYAPASRLRSQGGPRAGSWQEGDLRPRTGHVCVWCSAGLQSALNTCHCDFF